jgi:acetyltransferase-like isoleucine patch superfamily enzyme
MGKILIRGKDYEIRNDEPVDIFIPEFNIIVKSSILGKDVLIWSNVNIYGAEIGDETKIGAFVEIRKGVKIGKRVKIEPLVFIPEGIIIEDCVFLGPNVVFTNDLYPKSCEEDGSLVQEYKITETIVKKRSALGAGSVIRCGITIGENSIIGAGSVVVDDVPPNSIFYGEKAKFRRYL